MELKLDRNKTYGLALEGGGAKGAYQIGAWRSTRALSSAASDVYKRQLHTRPASVFPPYPAHPSARSTAP